jgi:hypothetical protein
MWDQYLLFLGVEISIIARTINRKQIVKETILSSGIASHVTTEVIIVPGVQDYNGRPAEVLTQIPFHVLFPFKDILLHSRNVWQCEATVHEMREPLGSDFRRVQI